MSTANIKTTFLSHIVERYLKDPEQFLKAWHKPTDRRAMIQEASQLYGYNEADMSALIDENLLELASFGSRFANDTALDIQSRTERYPGSKIYLESVTPGAAVATAKVRIDAVVYTRRGAWSLEFNLLGQAAVPLTDPVFTTHGGQSRVSGTAALPVAGLWSARATLTGGGGGHLYDEIVDAITVT